MTVKEASALVLFDEMAHRIRKGDIPAVFRDGGGGRFDACALIVGKMDAEVDAGGISTGESEYWRRWREAIRTYAITGEWRDA